jgi:hypothetical protein
LKHEAKLRVKLSKKQIDFWRLRIKNEPVIIVCVGAKNQNSRYFDAKLRFALFASLRSAISSEIKGDN